jgi:hypothetical protein
MSFFVLFNLSYFYFPYTFLFIVMTILLGKLTMIEENKM